MRSWLQKIIYRYNCFMQGRYGYDAFGKALLIGALVCTVLSYFPYLQFFSVIALLLLIYYTYRTLSRNFDARRKELNKYYIFSDKFKKHKRLVEAMWRDRKTHVYYKCKNCKAMIRVPKNKGEIEVTCPRCRMKTTKKT